tara:strand:- start:317 stop:520 length:204 start_codon:yes stop_codon:yes gene_type:complete
MNPSTIEQFCIAAKARIEDMVGREVMIIPIRDLVGSITLPLDDYRKWVLVVEKDGETWIWDSYAMEG